MDNNRRIMAVACAAEAGTGLGLLIVPSFVVGLLLGAEPLGIAIVISRVAGIALIALAIACWPDTASPGSSKPYVGMLTYNALVALVLAQVGLAGATGGILLWPVALFHLVLAILLTWAWFDGRRASATQV
jgi:hypothetical protein